MHVHGWILISGGQLNEYEANLADLTRWGAGELDEELEAVTEYDVDPEAAEAILVTKFKVPGAAWQWLIKLELMSDTKRKIILLVSASSLLAAAGARAGTDFGCPRPGESVA
jgi:hypothetical protein